MVMRISLVLALLFSMTAFAAPRCRLDLRPAGTYFTQCPRNMIAQHVDVWNPGPSPYPQVRVGCAQPEIICTDVKKDLRNTKN